jgi:hypothetical protein
VGIDRLPAWSTHSYERVGESASRVLIAVTDARCHADDRTFVVVQGFQSWIESFEMQRFQLIAHGLRARLIIVEVPGFGVAGSRLLRNERRGLLAGDFRPLAERMFEAAGSIVTDTDRDEPLSFLGYSMGASIATAMTNVAVAQGWSAEELVLVEPVALQRWKLRELISATRREDRWTTAYTAANEGVEGAAAPWDQRPGVRPPTKRRVDLLLLGAALRHGGLAADLLAGAGPRRVIVVRGDRSALSGAAYFPILARLRQRGIATAELTVPGHHAFWHSLAAVHDMTSRLAALLDTSN